MYNPWNERVDKIVSEKWSPIYQADWLISTVLGSSNMQVIPNYTLGFLSYTYFI